MERSFGSILSIAPVGSTRTARNHGIRTHSESKWQSTPLLRAATGRKRLLSSHTLPSCEPRPPGSGCSCPTPSPPASRDRQEAVALVPHPPLLRAATARKRLLLSQYPCLLRAAGRKRL